MGRLTVSNYTTRPITAPWCTCDTCGEQASKAISIEVAGRYGRKGSRTLGMFCDKHVEEKLKKLYARRR